MPTPTCDSCGSNLLPEFRLTFNPFNWYGHCEKCGRSHHFVKRGGQYKYHVSHMPGRQDIMTTCSKGHYEKPDAAEIYKSPRGYTMIECHRCGERMIFG